jgi:hypothetical protein
MLHTNLLISDDIPQQILIQIDGMRLKLGGSCSVTGKKMHIQTKNSPEKMYRSWQKLSSEWYSKCIQEDGWSHGENVSRNEEGRLWNIKLKSPKSCLKPDKSWKPKIFPGAALPCPLTALQPYLQPAG